MLKTTGKRILRHFGYELVRCNKHVPEENVPDAYFLHISKNAGTQITNLCKQIEVATGVRLEKQKHEIDYTRLPEGCRYFFSIRDPISRFKSAFYSRKRKGQPRLYNEWNPHEEIAFSRFEHANDLAECLFREDALGSEAIKAVLSISHTARHQVDWFKKAGQFLTLNPPIWIIRQEHFTEDFSEFLSRGKFGVEFDDLQLSNDEKIVHSQGYKDVPELSGLAVQNLERWYARDRVFYNLCQNWMNENRT